MQKSCHVQDWNLRHYLVLTTHYSNILTRHPITHFLKLKNTQNTPQRSLAPKPSSVSNPKTQKTHLFVGPTH